MEAYLQFVHAAEARDQGEIARLIREHPELHDYQGADGGLLDVIHHNCQELLEAGFKAGLSPDAGPPHPHQTLMQVAAANDDVELVRLCLAYGAEVERRNCEGETALGYAAAWASIEIVRAIVEAGADVNAVEGTADSCFTTALDATCSTNPDYDRPQIRDYLRERGAKRLSEL